MDGLLIASNSGIFTYPLKKGYFKLEPFSPTPSKKRVLGRNFYGINSKPSGFFIGSKNSLNLVSDALRNL